MEYLANVWNSEYEGFPHAKIPRELAKAAYLFPLLELLVYLLIIS